MYGKPLAERVCVPQAWVFGISSRMSPSTNTDALVTQLLALLEGGQAHATLSAALENFPQALRGTVPESLPYSAWQLLEHMLLAQRDILDFCAPPEGGYKQLNWPADYWPKFLNPPTPESWDNSIAALEADAASFAALFSAPEANLFEPFAWGEGQNLLREALLIADHNSYHTGELVVLRRLLGIWKH